MPIDREKVLQAAQKLIEKRRFDKAIIEYQKIVQEDPNDARILLKIGDLQARSEAFEAAIATYERVGRYYSSQGFSVKAIAVYKQIREIIRKHVPKLADQYGHIIPQLASLYQELGLTGDALSAYDEYATLLQRSGREREATEIFRKIVEINGTNPLARLRLAEALLRQSENEAAFDQFSIAAQTLLGMGRTDDALKVYERILYQQPDPVLARQAAQMYLQRGQADDGMMALAKLQICFQADNRDLDTLELLARAFSVIGQRPKALEVRKEIVRIAREKGNQTLARKTMEELVTEAPNDDAVRAMARSLFAADPDKAQSQAPPSSAAAQHQHAIPPPARTQDDATIEVSEEVIDVPPSADYGLDLSEPSIEEIEALSGSGVADWPQEEGRPPQSIRHVVVDDALEVAEDFGQEQHFDPSMHARQVVLNAEAYRHHRMYAKAIETLQIGLEIDPNSIEMHDALKETFVESGHRDLAIAELLTIAAIHVDQLQGQLAAQTLGEALELDPSNDRARSMLLELGYQPPPSLEDTSEVPAFDLNEIETDAARGSMASLEAEQGYDDEFAALALPHESAAEPLPSYDLEEINPSYAMSSVPVTSREQLPSLMMSDDPFAALDPQGIDEPFFEGDGEGRSAPLPSFPLLDEERTAAPRLIPIPDELGTEKFDTYDELVEVGPVDESSAVAEEPGLLAAPLAGTRGFQGGDSLEDALDEAEFFMSRGLFDDSLAIIQEQLQKFPNHPLLLERVREVREAASAASGSGELAVAGGGDFYEETEDRAFDIAASLEVLDGGPTTGVGQAYSNSVDVEEVFAKFKEGVKAQVSESDSATHYDLGVAYKEMGLHRDAIAEFEMATRDPKRECVAWSMIGMVHLDLSEMDAAVEAFIRGLHSEEKSPDQENALYYELGGVYDHRGNGREALYYFEKVARRDPGFRDVSQRIRSLRGSAVRALPNPSGAEDDFDRAFDDLFTGSKM